MQYRKIHLTLGELRVAGWLLSNPEKADIKTARDFRTVRASLGIRQANKDLDKLNEKGLALNVFPVVPTPQGPQSVLLQWDDLLDPGDEILLRLDEMIEALLKPEGETAEKDLEVMQQRAGKLMVYHKLVASLLAERECAITEDSLQLLSRLCTKKDWTTLLVRDRVTGIVREERTVVPAAQMDIFADLGDKIENALFVKEDES